LSSLLKRLADQFDDTTFFSISFYSGSERRERA